MPRHCYVLRVFTCGSEGGNGLGVVTDVLGLDDQKMQRIATDLGFSETIFLRWFDEPRPQARIFTPAAELPFAGHPLVGAAWLLLNLGPVNPGAIDCTVGTIGISSAGDSTWIEAPANQPFRPVEVDLGEWVEPLDTSEVQLPVPYLLVEVGSPDEVAKASVPGPIGGYDAIYLWSWMEGGRSVKARFFAPGVGVPEDPATGSAAVALAAMLRARGRTTGQLLIFQGAETGSPSIVELRWDQSSTEIGGTVIKDEVRFLST